MPKPNFLFIGPSKTASTWLFTVLDAHARVHVPSAKDIYFFDRHYDRGLEWYLKFFDKAPSEALAVGEICHDYLHFPETIDRIEHDLPGARLMTTLRHPLDRAVSEYRELFQAALVDRDFEKALAKDSGILGHSRYAHDLTPWLEKIPRERLLVQNFDDLQEDADAFAKAILDFLDVEWQADLPTNERVRAAGTSRNRYLSKLIKLGAVTARQAGFATLVGRIKSSALVRRALYRGFNTGEAPGPSRAMAETLIKDFEPDIQFAEHVLNRALPHWRQVNPRMLGADG